MHRLILAALLMAAMAGAQAADSYRFDHGVVTVGESIAGVIQRAGRPDRIVQLENKFGGGEGERWEYYTRDGNVVALTIQDSRVTRIDEVD